MNELSAVTEIFTGLASILFALAGIALILRRGRWCIRLVLYGVIAIAIPFCLFLLTPLLLLIVVVLSLFCLYVMLRRVLKVRR